MSEKFIIGCDADGVLTDLSAHNIRAGRAAFAREAVAPDAYALDEMFDVSDLPKWKKYLKAFGIYRRYCKYEPACEGAADVIAALTEQGFGFHAVTARKFATNRDPLGKMARRWFETWLKKTGIHFEKIHYCSETHSPQDKLLACRKLGVDAMIEDRPDNALYLARNGIRVLMTDAPYNRDTAHENITRVNNWKEIAEALSKLKAIDTSNFVPIDHENIDKLNNSQKQEYFRRYQRVLQGTDLNEEKFRKGDRRFRFLYRLLKIPAKLFFSVKVSGTVNLPYQDGFIIACNHCDSTDQYKLGLALGNRPFVGYAAKELIHTFRGKIFDYTGLGLFIDRNDHDNKKAASEKMASYVAHNRTALIFPEGTRKNKTPDGRERFQNHFKLGTAVLAQKTGAGILPVAVNSFGRRVYVRFGEMIYVTGTDSVVQKTKELERAEAALSMNNYACYYEKHSDNEALAAVRKKYQSFLYEIDQKGDV